MNNTQKIIGGVIVGAGLMAGIGAIIPNQVQAGVVFNGNQAVTTIITSKTSFLSSKAYQYENLQKQIVRLQAEQTVLDKTFVDAGFTNEADYRAKNPLPVIKKSIPKPLPPVIKKI